jgi:hypothetical protein
MNGLLLLKLQGLSFALTGQSLLIFPLETMFRARRGHLEQAVGETLEFMPRFPVEEEFSCRF